MLSVAVSFALPACPSNGYFHNCFSTYDFANGDKYVGQWNGSKKNGLGAYTFTNGNKYVGDWNDDKKNGQGTFIWPDGEKYVGEWKDNRFQYGSKTPPPLLTAFINLSKDNRKKAQSILSDLGFYKSSNDGLYGKKTSAALTAYNKKNLNDDDLTNSENVIKLITVLLDIETSPTPALLGSKDWSKIKGIVPVR
jgi:hypothetical protein